MNSTHTASVSHCLAWKRPAFAVELRALCPYSEAEASSDI